MAAKPSRKFIQIATSSVVIDGRLYTIINALDEQGEVWQFRPENRTNIEKGTWVQVASERK